MAYEGVLYIKTDNQEIQMTGDTPGSAGHKIKLSTSDFDSLGLATNIAVIDWNGSSGTISYNDGTATASLANIDAYDALCVKMAVDNIQGEVL